MKILPSKEMIIPTVIIVLVLLFVLYRFAPMGLRNLFSSAQVSTAA